MKYKFLLFDADNTMLDFDANERLSLSDTFRHFGIPCDEKIQKLYHDINIMYWTMLAENRIDRQTLLVRRFETLFERIGIKADAVETEDFYRTRLGMGCQRMEGAMETVKALRLYYGIYVITNGVAKTQRSRLEGSGFASLCDAIFISDDIGYNKPERGFFEHVARSIPGFDRKKALVIGDSLCSDIRGGFDFGIDTCWLNVYDEVNTNDFTPTYEIQSIKELIGIL